MVRGLASDLPAGPDLSKAKAWIKFSMSGSGAINASYNVKSITDSGTGSWTITFGIPFKSSSYVIAGAGPDDSILGPVTSSIFATSARVTVRDNSATAYDSAANYVVFFGELENE